jgi:hypothetical protein
MRQPHIIDIGFQEFRHESDVDEHRDDAAGLV